MKSFFKFFLASFLALIIFVLLGYFILAGMVGGLVASQKVSIHPNSVLEINMQEPILEQSKKDPLNAILNSGPSSTNGLHDMLGLIQQAATDDNIKGIYLKLGDDPNGLATNEDLRNALLQFKKSHKFIYAYGDYISQKAYYVATAADKIFLNPKGELDFRGFSTQILFLKGTLDKLEIEPQIFYDGKFKSATEPLRVTQMTEPNRIQTSAFLNDLYFHFLNGISKARNIDTATLFQDANQGLIQSANDALQYNLVDGLSYDDQMMDTLRRPLELGPDERINFVSIDDYQKANDAKISKISAGNNSGEIAIIYAQGDIVDGTQDGDKVEIAADDYVKIIRKVREDDDIKAIVFRVNSPGGSALAAEKIWRELSLAENAKPVIVSMGDYAASGGYYISCMADTIFAQPNTLTGSIGVFTIIPNLQKFFNDKLGITFDGVKTAQFADMNTISRPLTPAEKRMVQNDVDSIYATFKDRVVAGRKLSPAFVDSIAQGRVWSGKAAIRLGLADKTGGIKQALQCAANMAHLSNYTIDEYPSNKSTLEKLLDNLSSETKIRAVKSELGNQYKMYEQLKSVRSWMGTVQARLPYAIDVE